MAMVFRAGEYLSETSSKPLLRNCFWNSSTVHSTLEDWMSLTARMAGFRRSERHSAQAQNFPLEYSEHTPPIFR